MPYLTVIGRSKCIHGCFASRDSAAEKKCPESVLDSPALGPLSKRSRSQRKPRFILRTVIEVEGLASSHGRMFLNHLLGRVRLVMSLINPREVPRTVSWDVCSLDFDRDERCRVFAHFASCGPGNS
jgi:hypothetical protein